MSSKSDTEEAQISSLTEGEMLVIGATMPLKVTAPSSSSNADYEIEVTVTSSKGEEVWHNRTAVTLDEQMNLELPQTLTAGQYKVEYVLYSSGEEVQKKTVSFFVAKDGWKITSIKSFPLVITSAATVMLKAELEVPEGATPYLRWSWKGKSIAKGLLSEGLDKILWVTPTDSGVYTVSLEVFPIAPSTGSDYSFTSSLALSTDIVVSASSTVNTSNLGADSSYLSILHMQATLDDAGTGGKKMGKTKAVAIGTPEIVVLEDRFGYKLDGSTGMQIPWLALPMDGGVLKPFTLSLALSLTDPFSGGNLVKAAAADGSLTLTMSMDGKTGGPVATLAATGAAVLTIPWSGPALSAKQHYLLSLSIVPLGASLTAQWFLDGTQVSDVSTSFTLPALTQEGTVTIGGEKGFEGVTDELGIYTQDPAGRPAPDPDLYARAQAKLLGAGLVLADGFDGINLASGCIMQGKGQLTAGSLSLPASAAITLPPVKIEGAALTMAADLAPDSARTATLLVAWEGATEPAQSINVVAGTAGFRFELAADGVSLTVLTAKGEKTVTLPAADNEAAQLLITIQNLADATTPLVLEQVLISKDKT